MPGGYDPNRPRGREALTLLVESGKLFGRPIDWADITEKDLKTVYGALERGEIPHNRDGQRYKIPIAWMIRQVEGLPDPEPARLATSAA